MPIRVNALLHNLIPQ